ncbi:hypothetical protein [Paenibacillus ehimensis]|uniref:hypothetical protein n=1 Tax=Paenibacillus ehimensis TaxID=79264 RepID=UPI00046F859D|nr:hypothetical protein [Paenibacillus ehimensis]
MPQQPMYPAAVNSLQTELAAAVDATQTTISVADASLLPDAPNLVTIGSDETAETIIYRGKSGNTLTGVTRGFQGTAKGWSAGIKVARYFTAYDHDTFRGNIQDLGSRMDTVESALPLSSMSRQAIINGNFDVWQRGTSFAYTGSRMYCADRWNHDGMSTAASAISRQLLSVGTIPHAYYYFRFSTGGAGSGYTATSYSRTSQSIENGTRYLAGEGKKVTVSFWARSSVAGKKLGVFIAQNYGTGGSPSPEDLISGRYVTLTSNWAKYTHTFSTASLVGKTFGTNNDDVLSIQFWYVWGTSFANLVGDTVAETFRASGDIDIAQVQVCAGEVDLPFQPRCFAEELALCQRYYERYDGVPGMRLNLPAATADTSTNYRTELFFRVPKRVTPTMTQGGAFRFIPGGAGTTLNFFETTPYQTGISATTSGATVGNSIIIQSADTGGWIAADAEL